MSSHEHKPFTGSVADSVRVRGRLRHAARRATVLGLLCAVTTAASTARAADATGPASGDAPAAAQATLAEIESCASENLPSSSGVIGFSVDAVDRNGAVTSSRAELRYRKPDERGTEVLLVVSEPAKTAGTALLIIDRKQDKPEFFVRLPEMKKVKRVRSRRLRGPVLGTDFSYEDLKRLREPINPTDLEVVGSDEIDGRATWLLETVPGAADGSEYARVLTHVDQQSCLPLRIDLFQGGRDGSDRLRKRLAASSEAIRPVSGQGTTSLPHEYVMQDFQRETRTIVRIEHIDTDADLSPEQFTRAGLQGSPLSGPAATKPSIER